MITLKNTPWLHSFLLRIIFGLNVLISLIATGRSVIRKDDIVDTFAESPCTQNDYSEEFNAPQGCLAKKCGWRVADNLFQHEDIMHLIEIVNKGMSQHSSDGGPTILDINTGYIRDTNGIENLFTKDENVYSDDDFSHYGDIIKRLKTAVMETFNITQLYFTAPTFITRLDGRSDWEPAGIHHLL